METQQLLALVIAGAVAPWVVEIFKTYLNTASDKLKVTVSIVISFIIALGVLAVTKVNLADPRALFDATTTVFAVATAVYQFLKAQVQQPVAKLLRGTHR